MRDDQAPALEALLSANAYPHATGRIRTIETHISWVYLTGDFAYKIKKAVRLPYVDFSTLALREKACRDELALNRRLAPMLYEAVVTVGGAPGAIRVGGTPALEFAVKMRQFPDDATADSLIRTGTLGIEELTDLAETVAGFHASLTACTAKPPHERILANLGELESDATEVAAMVGDIAPQLSNALGRTAETFERRQSDGRIRECHGDLHLGNIVRLNRRLVPFDCLEFSQTLRTIDVIDEVAFLFMDLAAHGRPDLAFAFLNRYLEATGDYAGLEVLRIYATHRALVRAKVALATATDTQFRASAPAMTYLDAAAGHIREVNPICIITFGLSGSGKTTISEKLALELGAVHVRSDIERKRLEGLAAGARTDSAIDRGIYRPQSTRATYARLVTVAEAAIRGGIDVIVDASFLDRDNRDRFRALASRLGAGFVILHCTASRDVLRARIEARQTEGRDASEANLAVLAHQLETSEPLTDAETEFVLAADTEHEIDSGALAETIRRASQPPLSSTSY